MNVVDAALVEADGVTTLNGRTLTALVVLAAEVRRLRAAVEAIRALPRHNAVTGSYAVGVRMDCHDDGEWIYADDVLRILEATEASAHWAPCVQVHITDREW